MLTNELFNHVNKVEKFKYDMYLSKNKLTHASALELRNTKQIEMKYVGSGYVILRKKKQK